MKNDEVYLAFVLECINDIEDYTKEGKEAFFKDKKTQDAVLRKLHTLTESVQRISTPLKQKYNKIDWKNISCFRNVIFHDYFGIDLFQVWEIVDKNLPELTKVVKEIISDITLNHNY